MPDDVIIEEPSASEVTTETTTDATAESSTAEPQSPTEGWTSKEYKHWRETGEAPAPKKVEASAASGSGKADGSETGGEADASQKEKQEAKRKPNAEERIQELIRENKRLKAEKEKPADKGVTPTEPPAVKKEEKPEPAKKPSLETWTGTFAEYETALDAYFKGLADEAVAKDRTAREKADHEAKVAAQNQALEQSWKDRTEKAAAKHTDFAEVAFSEQVPINQTQDALILRWEEGPEILYHLGSNLELAKSIAGMDPIDTAEAMVLIRQTLKPSGKPATTPVPRKPLAPPETALGGKSTAPEDEAAAALKAGNFTRYKSLMDARDTKK